MDKSLAQKQIFLYLFLILALMLLFTPFITTFNDLLTRAVMSLKAYRFIQDIIVPWEVRMVGVILLPFGFKPQIAGEYLAIAGRENPFLIEIVWNCIGWQSLLFFIITSFVGLQGDKYTNISKVKALLIGLFGTFLVNLFRIALVALSAYYFGQTVAIIFHDYGSTLAVIIWLFFFWWFNYSYVLEERGEGGRVREGGPQMVIRKEEEGVGRFMDRKLMVRQAHHFGQAGQPGLGRPPLPQPTAATTIPPPFFKTARSS